MQMRDFHYSLYKKTYSCVLDIIESPFRSSSAKHVVGETHHGISFNVFDILHDVSELKDSV